MSRTGRPACPRGSGGHSPFERLRSRSPAHLPAGQVGQALAELLVVVAVLLPLWLAVGLIGKYAGLQQSAVQASRYAAFQRAEGLAADRTTLLEDQLRARFFLRGDGLPGNPRGEIRSADGASLVSFSGEAQVAWWRDHRGNPLLPDPGRVSLTWGTRAADSTLQASDGLMQGAFGLPAQQVHLAHVEVVLNDAGPGEAALWRIGATTAASADAANLQGSQGVRTALNRHAAVSFGLRALSALQTVVAVPMALLEDTSPTLPCMRVEAVPHDRLEGGPYHPGACR